MSDNKNYLGWGIIGTPKGRQAVGAGADLSLNLAKSFDLSQDFGACLPEPKLKDFTPLYSVALQRSGNYTVLGFAEYRPIYEQGQSRAGTYFGAFIESVNTQINENSAQTLLESLFELSNHQTQHFIDTQRVAYKDSIHGKNVPEPSKLLQIAQALQPLATNIFSQTPTEETLYIQCRQGQAVDALQAVLREQLFYRFKQIFFSESDHISAQVQKKPIAKMQLAYLENGKFLTEPLRNEIRYLHTAVAQQKHRANTAEQNLNAERANTQRQIEQKVAEELKNREGEYQTQIQHYQQQAQQAEQRAVQATKSVQHLQQSAAFGKQIFDLITNNSAELSQLAGGETVSNAQLQQSLKSLQGDIKSLLLRHNPSNTVPSPEEPEIRTVVKHHPLAWILSGLFFFTTAAFALLWLFSSNDNETPSLSPLIATEYGLEMVEGKIQPKAGVESPNALKEQIARLEKSLAELAETPKATIDESAIIGEFMRATCEANPKDGKKIDVHNRYADRYGKKLCP